MRRPGGTAPGARACGAARPFRLADHAGAVQGLRRRTPRGRSRAGSSNVAEGDVGARAGAGGRRSWCLSSGARCRTSVAADSRGTAPSRRVRRGAAARLRPTSPPARLGPCTICRAISWRCRRSGGRRGRAAARSPASSARSPASSAAAVHGAHGGSAHGPAHAATKPQQPPLRAGSGPDDAAAAMRQTMGRARLPTSRTARWGRGHRGRAPTGAGCARC